MENAEKKTRLELTAKFLDGLKATDKEQRYTDAKTPGLTFAVKPVIEEDKADGSKPKTGGSKLWRFRYMVNGVAKMISLGQYPLVGLKEAREKAFLVRKDLESGIDPVQKRRAAKQSGADKTFKEVAEKWIASRAKDKWVESHATRNEQRLKGNIYPDLGETDVNALTLDDFEKALQPVVDRGSLETAQRICALCIEILQYAARFKYLVNRSIIYDLQQFKKHDLPKPTKGELATITDPKKVGELLYRIDMSEYRQTYPVAIALQLAPLVMLRPNELIGGTWNEVNFKKGEWYIPAVRMKPKCDHVVPLSRQALTLLKRMYEFSGDGQYMFPSGRSRTHITTASLLMAIRRMKYRTGDFVTHGFRAMASTLLNGNKSHEIQGFDMQAFDSDLIEIQLSHAEKNKIRKAYNRRDPYARIQERREMLQKYADLLDFLKKQHQERSQ